MRESAYIPEAVVSKLELGDDYIEEHGRLVSFQSKGRNGLR
jgi:hypothetical protein